MPPPLSVATARHVVAAALDGAPADRCGVEAERLVRQPGAPTRRPDPAELAPALRSPMPSGSAVTLEPGGQVELSTPAAATVADALDRLREDEAELDVRLAGLGLRAVDDGVDLVRMPHRVLEAPRYAAMERFFAAAGEAGAWMMCNTASLQLNVGHGPEGPELRWDRAHALGPVLVAAFARSPGRDARGRRWESLRQAIWWSIDPGRTRPPRPRGSLVATWSAYALAADVMMIRGTDGAATAIRPGLPFARWCHEGVEIEGRRRFPDADDLRYHLTTLFPPVRARGWLELRMLDALPADLREVAALVATTALTVDADDDLVDRLPDTTESWCAAARHGLAHPVLAQAARSLFEGVLARLPADLGPDRRDAVGRYLDTFVAPACAPAQTVPDSSLGAGLRPQLRHRPVGAGVGSS